MKKQFLCIVLIGVFLITISQPYLRTRINASNSEATSEYIIHKTPQIPPYQEITSMVIEDGKIFLFFDAEGLVNVYSIDGVFQYALQVNSSTSGRGDIAYDDKKLYVFSRENHMYVFEDQKLVQHVDVAKEKEKYLRYEDRLLSKEKNHVYEGEKYYLLKTVSMVTKVTADGESVVVINLQK